MQRTGDPQTSDLLHNKVLCTVSALPGTTGLPAAPAYPLTGDATISGRSLLRQTRTNSRRAMTRLPRIGIVPAGLGTAAFEASIRELPAMAAIRNAFFSKNMVMGPVAAAIPTTGLVNNIALLRGTESLSADILMERLPLRDDVEFHRQLTTRPSAVLATEAIFRYLPQSLPFSTKVLDPSDSQSAFEWILSDACNYSCSLVFLPDSSTHTLHRIDQVITALQEKAVIGLTSGHGMGAKVTSNGSNNVVDLRAVCLSLGLDLATARYPVHHDEHGRKASGCAVVRIPDKDAYVPALAALRRHDGIYQVLERDEYFRSTGSWLDNQTLLLIAHDGVTISSDGKGEAKSNGTMEELNVPLLLCAPEGYQLKESVKKAVTTAAARNYDLLDLLNQEVELVEHIL